MIHLLLRRLGGRTLEKQATRQTVFTNHGKCIETMNNSEARVFTESRWGPVTSALVILPGALGAAVNNNAREQRHETV